MKHKFFYLQSLFNVALCVFMAMTFSSCSDDDDPKSTKPIEGEWISTDGKIYYQFLTDGNGRYICLADEPGYNPEYPDAAINKPVDPYFFDYKVEGDILTMKEYYGVKDKEDYTIYVCEIEVSKNVLQMKCLRTSENGIDWEDSNSEWKSFNRWTPKK